MPPPFFLGTDLTKHSIHHTHLSTCWRSEEHTSELQSHLNLVCRLLLEKKNRCPRADRVRDVPTAGGGLGVLEDFFLNDTATTEIYTLSLHDALPISSTCLSASSPSIQRSTEISGASSGTRPKRARGGRLRRNAAASAPMPARSPP